MTTPQMEELLKSKEDYKIAAILVFILPCTKHKSHLKMAFAPPLGLEPMPIAIGTMINSFDI